MGDVGVSCDEPCPPLCLVDGGLSEPPPSAAAAAAASLSVTRLLQHAILQLCNEHVGYHHTLQVLGVLCVTVDDRPQEIVVKVNNTLKRVDSYSASGTPDNVVRVSTTSTRNRNGDAGNYRSSCNSSTDVRGTPPVATVAGSPAEFESIDTIFGNGRSLVTDSDSIGGPFNDENASTDGSAERGMEIPFTVSGAAVSSSQSGRKCHGRKQSNPVKVKHSETADEDLLVNMHDRIPASGNGVVINGRSALKNSPSSSDRHPKSNQILRNAGHSTSTPVTVRSLLAKNSSTSTSGHVHTAADEMEDANDIPQVDRQQEMALNFSMDALDSRRAESRSAGDVTPRSESSLVSDTVNGGGVGDVRVKEESLPTPSPPPSSNSTPYGMEYLLNALSAAGNGSLYDISQLSQIMAAANFGSLIGSADGRYLPMSAAAAAAAGFDPHQLQALMYRMSTQLSGASGALAPPPPPLINCAAAAAAQRGSNDDVAQASGSRMDDVTVDGDQKSLGGARQLYSVSQQLNNGLTMHFSRMQNGIRRRRFGRNPGGVVGGSGGSSATKVKDIIMYDESAPLHAQRGSRIEGDFMLDALRADGKRRRRRTAEDSLTVEEIAEYMGGDGRSTADDGTPASYQIACRYCGEVSTDLSRYFAHTLSSHGAYVCHQCGKSFTTKSSLLRHRPIHTGMRRFACSICRKEFYRKDKCKAHIKRHLGIADGAPATAAVASALSGPLQVSPATVEQPSYHVDPINVSM